MSDTNSREQQDNNKATELNDKVQKQLVDMIGGVEKNLAITCEAIIGKMDELDKRMKEIEDSLEELTEETKTICQR